ncbi:MAG: polyprenol monophosphomannose synthase [Parcubacteria group bacterium]|nr:polyprenol monophosphomannose synthase [Parcubacteria group bacterium]
MISIILPTYNERDNLQILVKKILKVLNREGIQGNIIIIDDNSPDGTGEIAQKLSITYSNRVIYIARKSKQGLGSAYIAGFKKALSFGSKYIFEMDADLSHSPEDIPKFLKTIKKYDLVLGSRYINNGKIENWNLNRKLISKGGTIYAKTILGIPINDLTSGFKCFRAKVLETINLDNVQSDGYAFQIELTYKAIQKGFKIKEIPITFSERKSGTSKFSKKIFFEAMSVVWKLKFEKK